MANKDIGPCYACPPGQKKPGRDMHHVLPVEYGGAMDGRQVALCKGCHDEVHSVARHLMRNEPIKTNPNPVVAMLANYVVQQHAIFQNSGGIADDARNMVQFSCTVEEKNIAHDLKRMMGMRSLERMFKQLMFEEWQRRRQGR